MAMQVWVRNGKGGVWHRAQFDAAGITVLCCGRTIYGSDMGWESSGYERYVGTRPPILRRNDSMCGQCLAE